ncbi:Aste57867_1403 [Aphanomyces stellatus]|uniref:Aste57867_1403 protein n=1 Tax=Aphanomyces stellatus TaxID=120398 RepID=A0A485K9C0_9STRA|nr:hypothetical protein As57867_001402 [Aphanomyces stellatus]VFT78620.1 Aste57867_1403 [Aphanomyces stellatus]
MLSKVWNNVVQAEHNVKLAYLFTLTFFSCRTIIFEQVLSGYVFVLTKSNEPVGIVKGVQGIVQMLAAIPGGWACDHFRRDTVLKVSSALGIFCAIVSIVAFSIGHLFLIYVAFGFWGLFFALQGPALEALFADSIPHGERSLPFTIKHILMNVASVIGPIISLVFFVMYGDTWNLEGLQTVMIIGAALGLPALLVLFFFNDDLAYENYTSTGKARTLSHVAEDGILEYSFADDDAASPKPPSEASNLLAEDLDDTPASGNVISQDNTFLCFGPRHVPFLLFFSDFVICNGAGMTVSFFPVFFQNDYGLTPSQVNILYVALPVLVVVLTFLTQRASLTFGTIETVVFTRLLATLCLGAMAYATPLPLEVALFLLRTSFMWCSDPLRTSILMDYVPQHLRGRWNSLEGLTSFTYSGSAVVGGFLIEKHGYRYCFFITAVIYCVGMAIECLLVPIIRNDHASKRTAKVVRMH